MTTGSSALIDAGVEHPGGARRKRISTRGKLAILAAVFVAFCLVRWATGATQFTSVGSITATLVLTMPIAMAGLAGLWSERSGIVNIGLEGMLIAGTIFGAWQGSLHGPWVGVIAGMIGGALFGLIHAIATVTFGVDHIVSGVAINLLALGVAGMMAELLFPESNGKQSPPVGQITKITLPWSNWMNDVQHKGIPVVSDLAGIVGGLTTNLSLLTILCLALFPITFYILWRTAFGLRVRSSGENPQAAETLGVNVYKMKYIAVIISGAMGGIGGAYLVTVSSQIYLENQTGGRGYVGLAALIFGNWTTSGTLLGSLLFGYTSAVNARSDLTASTAIVVLVALGLAMMLVLELRKLAERRAEVAVKRSSHRSTLIFTVVVGIASVAALVVAAIRLLISMEFIPGRTTVSGTPAKIGLGIVLVLVLILIAAVIYFAIRAFQSTRLRAQFSRNLGAYVVGYVIFGWMWLSNTGIPQSFKSAIPNIITLLVLAFAAQRLRPPAADGLDYRKGK
ncbi:nucleoside ABC transporter membrane protein [Antricoccus suffuscus]|uniref:Nucleoside ABC transporter membrane protein n=1 Tax=Antricoccus suffuscus TaxID=1629062 RepID=A0A2T0ZFW0_9ACTN|nr:ABC transporter permease [Antricoccus suffuscus]PRZ35242.1 nucleoside ABC transporter membrane protein [Antricoccus suffuscus]